MKELISKIKSAIKKIKFKFNLATIIILIALIIVIFSCLWGNFFLKKSSDSTAKTTLPSTLSSYPISYISSSDEFQNGEIKLSPKNVNLFQKQISNTENCDTVQPGIAVYYTDDYRDFMLINNYNLLTSDDQKLDFLDARNIIMKQSDFTDNNGELPVFKTYCANFRLDLMGMFDINYPNTEASRGVVGYAMSDSSTSTVPASVSGLVLNVYIYAVRHDSLILVYRNLTGDSIFTADEYAACSNTTSVGDLHNCLNSNYGQDDNKKQKLQAQAEGLVYEFELPAY